MLKGFCSIRSGNAVGDGLWLGWWPDEEFDLTTKLPDSLLNHLGAYRRCGLVCLLRLRRLIFRIDARGIHVRRQDDLA
ncbi:MAG: hypothetical protein DME23_15495 [Verrucomicrobia bacterium]|nr:MAG: hypothetical protein DME23_15495 [Verrucomicrobiota bacterium]